MVTKIIDFQHKIYYNLACVGDTAQMHARNIVGQHSKPIVHFVIQAPNLAQMYTNILRTFSDIGPLGILSLCPPYWVSKWPPFEIYICDYLSV